MDVGAVRVDVAALFDDLGFTQWSKVPDSIGELPAVIVSPPRSIDYGTTPGFALVTLPIDVVFNAATELSSTQDEADKAMGTTDSTSIYNAIHGATADSWRGALRVVGAEEPKPGTAGGANVLVVTFVVELLAPK